MKTKINKIELLSPAGDMNKAKIAFEFGADAIYLGLKLFSLRARASNFDFNDLKNILAYAHKNNKKVYLVTNIICNCILAKQFASFIKKISTFKDKPDAYICGDPYIIESIQKYIKNAVIHITTQQSVTNSKAALFWASNKAKRVILSREVSYLELKQLVKNVNKKIEIEIFTHGAVCISYSGRCTISNNFTYRDANIGGCAQSCRWEYDLYDKNKKLISKKFTMSSKDMSQIDNLEKNINTGISSLKIEGRMKSEYYIATVIQAYRRAIDNFYDKNKVKNYNPSKQILKAANREVSTAWFNGKPGPEKMLYHEEQQIVKQNYAFLISSSCTPSTYLVTSKNKFSIKNSFEVLSQNYFLPVKIKIKKIELENGEVVDTINTPLTSCKIFLDKDYDFKIDDMGRII